MGSNVLGFKNENNLIFSLNGKKVKDLNDNLKNFMNFLFMNLNSNDTILVSAGNTGQKPDMIVNVNNNIKRISIKIGNGNSVHQENIDLFMRYLSSIGISKETQLELLKYHWADGTINGTGKNRISGSEYKKINKNKINLINKEINQHNFLIQFVNRFLFQGKSSEYKTADAIYYGNSELGHWASKDEILKYILSNSFVSKSIHFGPLNYQVWNRCLNFNPKTEARRNIMQIKWSSLLQDIIYIERNRGNNV